MINNTDKFTSTEYLNQYFFDTKRSRKSYAFWLVGNSGSGKSTLAKTVEKMLAEKSLLVKCLDGDNMRNTINSDLDLSIESRTENVRRSSEISKMFLENGTSTINCFISPTEESRNQAQKIIGERFRLIYIKASQEEVKNRDVKGLYKDNAENMNRHPIKYSANILFNFIINQPI